MTPAQETPSPPPLSEERAEGAYGRLHASAPAALHLPCLAVGFPVVESPPDKKHPGCEEVPTEINTVFVTKHLPNPQSLLWCPHCPASVSSLRISPLRQRGRCNQTVSWYPPLVKASSALLVS